MHDDTLGKAAAGAAHDVAHGSWKTHQGLSPLARIAPSWALLRKATLQLSILARADRTAHDVWARLSALHPAQLGAARRAVNEHARCHQQSRLSRLATPHSPEVSRSGGAAAKVAEHAAHILLGDGGAGHLVAQRRQNVVRKIAHAGR